MRLRRSLLSRRLHWISTVQDGPLPYTAWSCAVPLPCTARCLPRWEVPDRALWSLAIRHLLLLCAGLSLINISLDTLRADRFERMTRRRGHERVLETIQQAVAFGYDPVKVGCPLRAGPRSFGHLTAVSSFARART